MTMTQLPISRDAGEIPATPIRKPGRPVGSKNKQNAVRDAERAQKRRLAEMKRARYEKQEAKRAQQLQVDQTGTLRLLVALTAVTFITTAVLTADGTISAAALARFASPTLAFVLFGAVEVAVLSFMLLYYIIGSREDVDGNPIKAGHWFVAMLFASAVAVGLNVYHVFDVYEFDWLSSDMWVGVGIRFVVALFFVMISKGLASAVFARAVRL